MLNFSQFFMKVLYDKDTKDGLANFFLQNFWYFSL